MIYTNKHKLPSYIVKWLTNDQYDHNNNPKVISATSLMKPAKATYLSNKHREELEVDCSDMCAIQYGNALHNSFEELNLSPLAEKRYYVDIGDYTISGKPDLPLDGKLIDFKSCSVWKYVKRDYLEYILQLSIYRWLMHESGDEMDEVGQICFLFTDWSGSKAKYDRNYPQSRIAVVDMQLLNYSAVKKYITDRLIAISTCSDDNLPDCTQKELWQDPDIWAVRKIGAKKAVKLYSGLAEATEALKVGQEVDHRIGKAKRCNYCNAFPFCKQGQQLKKDNLIA
jgi:hypothetical protein